MVLIFIIHIVKSRNHLKYCKCYISEDRKKYGEVYWHLEYQLNGVLICRKHNNILRILNKYIDRANRWEYLNLEENMILKLINTQQII